MSFFIQPMEWRGSGVPEGTWLVHGAAYSAINGRAIFGERVNEQQFIAEGVGFSRLAVGNAGKWGVFQPETVDLSRLAEKQGEKCIKINDQDNEGWRGITSGCPTQVVDFPCICEMRIFSE